MDNEISLLREILQEIENIIIEGHEFGLVDEVTDGDTTHAVTPNAVYHAIAERIIPDVIKIVTDKGTASADTMNKLYIEVANDTADVYYTVENNSTYTWKRLDDDILDNLSIDWSDIQNKPNLNDYIQKSNTSGLVKNNGTIDTTPYADTTDFDTIEATITYTNSTTETVEFYIVPNNP